MADKSARPTVWHIGGDDVHKRIPLLQALEQRGFNVAAVGSEPAGDFDAAGIRYYRYDLQRKLTPLADLRTCKALSALFTEHWPDVVHGFDPKPAIAAPILGRRAGIRGRVRTITGLGFVMTSHSPVARALRPVYRNLQRRASDAGFTIFQNPDDRDSFLRDRLVDKDRQALVLGSGVDVEEMRTRRPAPDQLARLRNDLDLDGKRVVTMISRVDENKGVGEFAAAADIVARQHSDVVCLLVGPFENEGKWASEFVARLRRGPAAIRYLGLRKDIPAILALSDINVLPSYREGVPRVLIEGGAMGLAAVATDVPGCREVVRHNLNGLLVPPRNSSALAAAILELLDDEPRRKQMGARAYQHVKETFDLSYVADAYADIYRRVLHETA